MKSDGDLENDLERQNGKPQSEGRISTAEEAAASIRDGMTVAMSGYAMAGYPKAVVEALVQRKQSGEDLSFESDHRRQCAMAGRERSVRRSS